MLETFRNLFPKKGIVPKGENPIFDKQIHLFYNIIYSFVALYALTISITPYEYIISPVTESFVSMVNGNFTHIYAKYETLETVKTGLGFKAVITFSIFASIFFILFIYSILITIKYWRPCDRSEKRTGVNWLFIGLFCIILLYVILPFLVFFYNMTIKDPRYPGSAILYNSEYYLFIVAFSLVFMAHGGFFVTSCVLKIIRFRERPL